MYHAIVERLTRRMFQRVNDHDYAALLASCAPDIVHRFGGDHALGGTRHDREALGRWFERLGRLLPHLRLEVQEVWVKGWPHATTVFVRWVSSQQMPDGSPYLNHGVHIVRMRWGKAIEIDANEDSQAVARLLSALAERGVTEAAAAPITSQTA